MIADLLKKFLSLFSRLSVVQRIYKKYVTKDIIGLNFDPCNKDQKRVLIIYLSPLFSNPDRVLHANWFHYYEILHYFMQKDYCIDICDCHENGANAEFKDYLYDIIIGFGEPYKTLVKTHKEAFKILFLTENVPSVARKKYQERLFYFKRRHPEVKCFKDNCRIKYYDDEQVRLSDACIVMNSPYNADNLKTFNIPYKTIVSNAIANDLFKFEYNPKDFKRRINKIVFFGCNGLIHKGLDIVLDAFGMSPNYSLDIFGLSNEDRKLFNRLKYANCYDCGSVNVMDVDFLKKVVNEHAFVILDSCSEGMNTGVVTCMLHGLIPIVTREVGIFDEGAIILEDYKVEYVKKVLDNVLTMTEEELLELRAVAYSFAQKNYTIDRFKETFATAMTQLSKFKT